MLTGGQKQGQHETITKGGANTPSWWGSGALCDIRKGCVPEQSYIFEQSETDLEQENPSV